VITSAPLLIYVRQVLIERFVLSYLYDRRPNAVSEFFRRLSSLEFCSDEMEVS
jgi:hypothetical protein